MLRLRSKRGKLLLLTSIRNWCPGAKRGLLPAEFALPAGIGDILVGLTGLALAFWLPSGSALSRKAAYGSNVLELADLVIAVATGFLTSPGPLQQLALDHPNLLITAYPLVMVPAFAVPLAIILHILSLWQLNRQSESVAGGRPPLARSRTRSLLFPALRTAQRIGGRGTPFRLECVQKSVKRFSDKDARQNKYLEPAFDSIKSGQALEHRKAQRRT